MLDAKKDASKENFSSNLARVLYNDEDNWRWPHAQPDNLCHKYNHRPMK